MCPSWCITEHQRAIEEGCDPETVQHATADVGGRLEQISNGATGKVSREGVSAGWGIQLTADQDAPFWGMPFVELEVESGALDPRRVVLDLTSGEARVLARQLVHFADLMDLGA